MKLQINTNYHTHIYLCQHATGTMDDYIQKAIKLGYKTIAITDHVPFPNEYIHKLNTKRMSLDDYYQIYLVDATRVKETYKEQIEVLIGLETEYLDFLQPYYKLFKQNMDFLILGQHYLTIDDEYQSIYKAQNKQSLGVYVKTVKKALATGLFTFIAHPDIFLFNRPVWDELSITTATEIIKASIMYHVPLELNANGIRNAKHHNRVFYKEGKVRYPYPNYDFWQLASDLGAEVVINDDCHAIELLLDDATYEAYQMADDLNLKVINKLNLTKYK